MKMFGRRYQVGTFSEERKALRERTAESLALEESHQPKEPLADTKPILSIEDPHQLGSSGDTLQTLALEEPLGDSTKQMGKAGSEPVNFLICL